MITVTFQIYGKIDYLIDLANKIGTLFGVRMKMNPYLTPNTKKTKIKKNSGYIFKCCKRESQQS